MPTGYTGPALENKWGVKEYAERCARALGAFVMYRDDSTDIPLPKTSGTWSNSSHHEAGKAKAEAELTELEKMSETEKVAFGEEKKAASIAGLEESIKKSEEEDAYYNNLLEKVKETFHPPEKLKGWKDFMISQLNVTLEHCGEHCGWAKTSRKTLEESKKKDPITYYDEAVKSAKRSMAYHMNELNDEKSSGDDTQEVIDLIHKTLDEYVE